MRFPQVSERVKEAPAHALRAVFASIGQVLLVTDRMKNKAAGEKQAAPPAPSTSASGTASATKTVPAAASATQTVPAAESVPEAMAGSAPVASAGPAAGETAAAEAPVEPAETGADAETTVTEAPVEAYAAGAPTDPAATEAPIGHAATETAMAAEAAEVTESAAAGAPTDPAATEAPIGHAATETAMAAEAAEVMEAAAPVGEAGPPIANYGELSVASLRARLRGLTVVQVREVIAYERANANRPEVIAMFERRVAKLEAPEG
jgi:hypothetical protein